MTQKTRYQCGVSYFHIKGHTWTSTRIIILHVCWQYSEYLCIDILFPNPVVYFTVLYTTNLPTGSMHQYVTLLLNPGVLYSYLFHRSFLLITYREKTYSVYWQWTNSLNLSRCHEKKITPYSHWLLHTSVKEISPIILIVTVIPICLITFSQHIFVFLDRISLFSGGSFI